MAWDDDLGIRHQDWVPCSSCEGTGQQPSSFTTEQVAWEQSIPVGQLLDTHFAGRDPGDLVWTIVSIPLSDVSGNYEPRWYYEDEGDYMAALEAAIDAGEVPHPAFIRCGDSYDHADGAHRLVVAMRRGATTITAYAARCTIHEQGAATR